MLNVLLESRARRDRRRGGTVVSVALHATLVVVVVLVTMRESEAGETPPERQREIEWVAVKPIDRQPTATPRIAGGTASDPAVVVAAPPPVASIDFSRIPVGLPEGTLTTIDAGPPAESSIAARLGTDSYAIGSGMLDDGRAMEVHAVDRAARVLTALTPRYPDRLRALGIGGQVVVQFVIDTLGRVEPEGIRVVESSHDDFTGAVRAVLPRLRFVPAEAAGRRVRQLARMPFEFRVK